MKGGKQKTHSGSKKRFRVRNSGSVKVSRAARRHLLTGKNKSRDEGQVEVHPTRMKALRRKMPGKIKTPRPELTEEQRAEKNAA